MTDATSSDRDTNRWRRRAQATLGWLGGFFLGAVLLVGFWAKGVHPAAFVEQIGKEGLDFLLPAGAVAFIALGLEVALGAALVLGVRRLWILVPAGLLVVFFLFLTGRAYWDYAHGIVDEAGSCGCFGNLVERTPAEAFWQDLFLLVPPLMLAFLARPGKALPRVRVALVAGLTVAGLIFAWQAPDLPLDDVATRLKPGVQVEEICSGKDDNRVCLTSIVPEIETGEDLVVLVDLEDPAFAEAVDSLNRYVLSDRGPSLWVVSASPPDVHHSFFWQWGPSFEIREGPQALLRPLHRRLPRSFRVLDGEVIETFSGLPPLGRKEAEAETT